MTQAPLHILTVAVPVDAVEELSDWLAENWEASPVEIERPGSPVRWLESYFASEEEARLAGLAVQDRFHHACEVRACEDKDWSESWKEHFHPQRIGERLWLCPPWTDDPPPREDAIRIEVNPGLSFGTGGHFTTRFCLEALERLLTEHPATPLRDLGSGSGILCIAAVQLGCPEAVGYEFDPLAIGAARENVARNPHADRIRLEQRDLMADPVTDPAPLIVANLFDQMLIEMAPGLIASCTGRLVVSGIRAFQADVVGEVFQACGAEEIGRDSDHEWCGMIWDCAGSTAG